MKRQIADFLGELAEELGWEPELEEQRVRGEQQGVRPAGVHVQHSQQEPTGELGLNRSHSDLSAEVKHLRSRLIHLSAEVTQLRTEMARLKNLPAPPDAPREAPAEASVAKVRPRPAHLVPKQTSESVPPTVTAPAAVVAEPDPQFVEEAVATLENNDEDQAPPDPLPAKPELPVAPIVAETGDDSALELFHSEPTAKDDARTSTQVS